VERCVELGRYPCEERARQYWRLDNMRSFDQGLGEKSSGIEAEGVLPDVHPRTPAAAGKVGVKRGKLREGQSSHMASMQNLLRW
jgi:hypothetical protein